jgi:hypothetical protein
VGLPNYVERIESICTVMRLRLSEPPDLTDGCYYLLNSAVLFNRGMLSRRAERLDDLPRLRSESAAQLRSVHDLAG